MIVWNGFGFVVAIIGLAALMLAQYVAGQVTGDPQYYQSHRWVLLIGMLLAAALTFGLHQLLQRQKSQIVIDKDSGREIALQRTHSLFFVPVKWWPVVFVCLGIAMMFMKAKA